MQKGFIRLTVAAVLLSAFSIAHAQVYRCETASGVTYADMPCGDGAEEIEVQGDVMNSNGVGTSEVLDAFAANDLAASADTTGAPVVQSEESEEQREKRILREFMGTLESQRAQQMAEIDQQIQLLRDIADSPEFGEMPDEERANVNSGIETLEAQRADLEAQYASMIEEANSRLQ